MTAPINLEEIVPSKAKAWVGLFGTIVTLFGPQILADVAQLSSPWPTVAGILFAVLTALGIYRAPYKPKGTTLALDSTQGMIPASTSGRVPVAVPAAEAPPASLGWGQGDRPRNPWKNFS